MTTREKLVRLTDELRRTPAKDVDADARGMVEVLQIAEGFGIDFLGMLVPDTDAEADVLIDKIISLLLFLRGDDLPPFSADRYGEAMPA